MVQTDEITNPEAKEVRKAKAKGSDSSMEVLSMKVDADLKEQVEAVAEQDGKTPSEVCREILEKSFSGNPDRRRAGLLRSLGITKEQLKAASKDEDSLPWFKGKPFTKVIKAIEELEEELNPTPRKSWLRREA